MVGVRIYTWKNDDGTFYVKIYDPASGIHGGGTHKDRKAAEDVARTYFMAEYKNLVEVVERDIKIQ